MSHLISTPSMPTFAFTCLPKSPFPGLSSLPGLPADVLIEIAGYLDTCAEILDLSLTCSTLYFNVLPALYASVVLTSAEQCLTTLNMLQHRPDLARHVRKLIVRPDGDNNNVHSLSDGYAVSSAVRQLARLLDVLHTFIWEGEEIPPYDDMWFALRVSCQGLRYIGSSLGSWLPDTNSHLFDFVGLRGFSLTFKTGFYQNHHSCDHSEELPALRNFWEMLTNSFPDLEELAIDGSHSYPADAHCLTKGRWPNLRKLTIGDVTTDSPMSNLLISDTKRPVISFLEAHTKLETLHLSRHALPLPFIQLLNPDALSNITSFGGTLAQVQSLPHIHTALNSLAFRDPIILRDVTPMALAVIFQAHESLRELRLEAILGSVHDGMSLLRTIVSSCPKLVSLDLTCSGKPAFQLDALSKSLRPLTALRTLSLTLAKHPADAGAPPHNGAIHIARSNPRLSAFRIAFVPSGSANTVALPFSPLPLPAGWGLLFGWYGSEGHAEARYTIRSDAHGLPVALVVRERRLTSFPFFLPFSLPFSLPSSFPFSSPFPGARWKTRRTVLDLRPGFRQAGKGWGLLMEHSLAGEEMRVILLCCVLLGLAVWGFWVTMQVRGKV